MRGILAVALLAGCAAPAAAPIGDLNAAVLEVVAGYPTDGSYGYWWPRDSAWEGTTQDIVYRGRKLCAGDPQHRSFCCGIVFEVYMKACERALAAAGRPFEIEALSAEAAHELRLRFFGDSTVTGDRRRCVQHALTSMGLGTAIDRLDDARPGDFVQFWRHSGSGHQVVFLGWEREGDRIVGLTYWSSQGSTRGIGRRTERIGDREGIKRDEIYVVRARLR